MEYGLIGYPLKHSFSKEIHEKIKRIMKNDNYNYELLELNDEDFESFMEKRNFKSINVTIPYKEKALNYASFLSDKCEAIKACNILVNKNGELYAYNSDYYGLKALIEKENIDLFQKKVLILGTGGTSKTAYKVAYDLGAFEIKKASRKIEIDTYNYDEIYDVYSDCDIIINTTPVGMYPNNDGILIDLDRLKKVEAIIDVIFNPLNTKLIIDAKKRGIKAIGGLYMLVSQAVYAYYFFHDLALNTEEINKISFTIYDEIIKEKENIVLIGMPSCGKSTSGLILSKKTKRELIDTDSVIESKVKMSIKDYINLYGIENFRSLETDIIKEVSKMQGKIIATGGGVILKEENMLALNQNSKIYYLNRSLDKLICTSDRPLSSSESDLKQRYEERKDLYLKYSDKTIDGNLEISKVVDLILEDFNG